MEWLSKDLEPRGLTLYMTRIFSIMAFVGATLIAPTAKAATVVAFTSVNGVTVAADVEGAGVSGFNLSRSTGLEQNVGSTFNSRDWQVGGSHLDAVANHESIFWGFNSTIGYDLGVLSFGYDRSNNGPQSIAVDFFIAGIFQATIYADNSVASNSTATAVIDLSGYDNVTNGFFRLSGWNAISSAGTFDIENRAALGGKGIVLTGQASVVPLPATLPLVLAGLGAFGIARRRRG